LRTEDDAADEAGNFCEENDDRPTKLRPRGVTVDGTTVRVEVVEAEDDEEVESAGEYERGDIDCESDLDGDDDDESFDGSVDCSRSLPKALLRFWR